MALLVLVAAPLTLLAQEDLTQDFTASDGSFGLKYPDGWFAQEKQKIVTLSNNQLVAEGQALKKGTVSILITVIKPKIKTEAKLLLDVFVTSVKLKVNKSKVIKLGSKTGARADNTAGDGFILAVPVDNLNIALVSVFFIKGDQKKFEPTILAIADSVTTDVTATTAETAVATESTLPEGVLFQDDFENGADQWIINGSPDVIQDKGNGIFHFASGDSATIKTGGNWTDYQVEMRIRVVKSADVDAVVAVRTSTKGGYAAYLSTKLDAAGIAYLLLPNTFNLLSRSKVSLAPNQWYALKITAKGTRVDLYLNKNRVNWINSKQLSSGTLLIGTVGGAQFDVDDVVVSDLNA
jgi:hypothetical protein